MDFLNNKEVAWKDLTVYIATGKVTKITNIKYKSEQQIDPLHAAGDEPIAIQEGNRAYSGTLTLLKGAIDDLNAAAIAAGGRDLMDLELDVIATYRQQGVRGLKVDTITGVRIEGYEMGMEQGATSMPVQLPYKCLKIIPG
ncbi:MAG: hypothetical protein EBZ77_06275 [Chitinophagia bacterium]|nr:hypothetical protein [Chitinophagia bacterium]